ncbi:MAG: Gfo/Idh/MocA family oxidoreductase [Balneolaceae bacterium]|nr:Gfo/Idh/MocA family oxidoreductase [Balneolaceae bacterium]
MSKNNETKKESNFSRRNFLKKSGMAAAAIAATPSFLSSSSAYGKAPAPGSVLGANDRLVAGFIGVGGQGYNAHLRRGVVAQSEEQNVVGAAVCDVWEKRVDRAQEALNITDSACYSDYRRLLDRDDIDVVFIGSVDHWHAKQAIDAMDAGKHVYLEKPMTRYLDEAFEVYDAAKRTGKVVQIGSQYCTEGKWHLAADMIRAGKIGPLVLAQDSYMRNNPDGEWNYAIDSDFTEDSANWDAWLGPVSSRPFSADEYFRWRKYYPYCSGIKGDLLAHRIHPLMISTGDPEFPTRVAALGTRKITTDRDVPDNTQIMAEFPSGLTMIITGSTVNEQGLGQVIRGHEATLYFAGNRVELRPERPFADLVDREEHENVQPGVDVQAHIANFFDAVRDGITPNGNIDLGIRVQTVLSLAEMSERLGEMLYFDPNTRTISNGSGTEFDPISYGTLELS